MPQTVLHDDPGLQPERTSLAWARTTVSYSVATAILLRWLPHYGMLMVGMIALMALTALGIYLSQRPRYRASARGLAGGQVKPQLGAVMAMTLGMLLFGLVGIFLILGT
ncbi:Inner membrane protein YidG [Corynebacterium occultum]|uniref:Inner membrane protein YidG n=1 Tax=Corynebacterium occultum TaxID=2675219 RepID=A0A6B8W208_9CORY|nr:DUF202 domain-containing protein [Corynebacterium occultum]QGU06047.1 Inner membrane protein YidG [Corynebacterium occultum]